MTDLLGQDLLLPCMKRKRKREECNLLHHSIASCSYFKVLPERALSGPLVNILAIGVIFHIENMDEPTLFNR